MLLPLSFDPIVGAAGATDASTTSASIKDLLFPFFLLLLLLLDGAGDKTGAIEVHTPLVTLPLLLSWPFLLFRLLFENVVADREDVDIVSPLLEDLLLLLPFRNIVFVILSPG